jgi:hypothetical protein
MSISEYIRKHACMHVYIVAFCATANMIGAQPIQIRVYNQSKYLCTTNSNTCVQPIQIPVYNQFKYVYACVHVHALLFKIISEGHHVQRHTYIHTYIHTYLQVVVQEHRIRKSYSNTYIHVYVGEYIYTTIHEWSKSCSEAASWCDSVSGISANEATYVCLPDSANYGHARHRFSINTLVHNSCIHMYIYIYI